MIEKRDGLPRYFNLAHRCLDIAENIFMALDKNGKIILINRKGCEIVGYEEEELIGKNWFDTCLPERNREKVKNIFQKLIAKEVEPSEYYVNPLLSKSGEERVIEWRISIMTDGTGSVTGVLSSGEDITEQKRTKKALINSEAQYRLLAENISDVIWVRDMNLQVTYVSPSVEKLRGYTAEEVMTQTIEESMTPASAELVNTVLAEELAIEGQVEKDLSRSRLIELEMKCKNDPPIWVEMKITFLRDQDNQPTGILGVSRDITKRKRVEEERDKLIAELQGTLQKLRKA